MKSLWTMSIALAAAMPVLAHHSFAAEYDANKPVELKGTVTKVEWTNPHTWFHVDVKNKDGEYVAPSVQSATTAADNATIKPDLTFSAIWAPGAGSYPITYQSWDLVIQAQSSTSTAANLKGYIGYLIGDGQKLLPQLNYAPLPSNIQKQAQAELSKIGS